MSVDSEKMKALVAFKEKLEKRLGELDAETREVSTTLDTVNSILLEKGFKRGDIKEVTQMPKELASSAEKIMAEEEKVPLLGPSPMAVSPTLPSEWRNRPSLLRMTAHRPSIPLPVPSRKGTGLG